MTAAEPTGASSASAIIARVREFIGDDDTISADDILGAMGRASFAPVLFLPAIAVTSPLSGVPGFSSVCGVMILLISVQILLGRRHLWLPGWITRRTLSSDKLRRALRMIDPVARFLDRITRARLRLLTAQPFVALPALICTLCGAAMPLLEFVPFTSSILGFAVALMSMAMLTRDGLLVLAGVAVIFGGLAAGGAVLF